MVKHFQALFLVSLAPLMAQVGEGTSCWIVDAASVESNVWLLCEQGAVLASRDMGKKFETVRVTGAQKFRTMAFVDATRGFIAGDAGTVLATEDGGKSWKPVTVPSDQTFYDIYFVGETGWMVGARGAILRTTDGGRNWSAVAAGANQTMENVYFLDAQHGWAVGWNGLILRTVDGGLKWEEIKTESARWSLNAVWFKDVNNGWAVGMFGQVLRSRDGGLTWAVQEVPARSTLSAILFDTSGRGWIASDNDVLLSEDGGENWKPVGYSAWYFPERLVLVGDSLWAVGARGILRRAAGSSTWEVVDPLRSAG